MILRFKKKIVEFLREQSILLIKAWPLKFVESRWKVTDFSPRIAPSIYTGQLIILTEKSATLRCVCVYIYIYIYTIFTIRKLQIDMKEILRQK